jgi:hypothetical protein
MESVSGGMLTCDDPTPVPIAYCVIVPGNTVQIWNWTTPGWEPMPASENPAKAHLRDCEPVFDKGLAAQLRCDEIPFVEPTIGQQIILMYRTDKNGEAAEYAGHVVPKKYPDTFTLEFRPKQ